MQDNYTIQFYKNPSGKEPVFNFIKKLPKKSRAKINWTIALLKENGSTLTKQYLKYLKNNLWELKPKNYRIFLSFFPKRKIILLHSITKKSQKTPGKDLNLALKRLKEYQNHYAKTKNL